MFFHSIFNSLHLLTPTSHSIPPNHLPLLVFVSDRQLGHLQMEKCQTSSQLEAPGLPLSAVPGVMKCVHTSPQLSFSEWASSPASALLNPKLLSGAKGRGMTQFWFTFLSRRGSQPTWEGPALRLPSLDWSLALTSVLLAPKATD